MLEKSLENAINIASETGDGKTALETSTVLPEGEEQILDTEIETVIPPLVEEKEPTVKELMARMDQQGDELKKSNSRVGYLQRKMDRSKGRVNAPIEPAKPKPTSAEFETNDEFVEALTDWKFDQGQRTMAENQTKLQQQDQAEDFVAVINSGKEKYADFDEVARKTPADGGPTITAPMLEAMMEGNHAVDVAYELGKNVAESERIAGLSPIQAAREIGLIEARFAGGISKTPQKTQTKTITPSSPIVGKTVSEKSLENQDMADFMSSRNKADGVA